MNRFTPSLLLARNATLNLFSEVWTFVVLLIAMPKLVFYLGETLFGVFSLAWVIIGYLNFLDIGVNRAATKFISEHLIDPDDKAVRDIVHTAFLANLILGVIGGGAVVLISPYLVHSLLKISPDLQNQFQLVFYAVGLGVPVLLIQGIFRSVLTSYQSFGWINGINAIAVAFQWGAAILLAFKSHSVVLVVFATVVVRLFVVIAYAILVSRFLPGFNFFELKSLKGMSRLVKFGSWVSVSQIVSPALVYLDRMLIASFVSLSAVTLYTIPYEMMTRLRVIPSSLATTLFPAFSERGVMGEEDHLQELYERSVRYLLLLLVPGIIFLVVLGSDILTIWMGKTFAFQTTKILQILAVGVLTNGISYVPYNILQALGRPDLTGKFHLLELPVYILLCLLLIPKWGIEGAAIASTIRFALDFALLFWAANKYCMCSLSNFWTRSFRHIALLGLILMFIFVGIRLMVPNSWLRLGLALAAVIAYIPASWILIVSNTEKPRLSGMVRNLLGESIS
jgi:O-antigen/teichoic acid export membrane protein